MNATEIANVIANDVIQNENVVESIRRARLGKLSYQQREAYLDMMDEVLDTIDWTRPSLDEAVEDCLLELDAREIEVY